MKKAEKIAATFQKVLKKNGVRGICVTFGDGLNTYGTSTISGVTELTTALAQIIVDSAASSHMTPEEMTYFVQAWAETFADLDIKMVKLGGK